VKTVASFVAVMVCLAASRGYADTFILADGGKIYGQKEKEFAGPDKQTWMIVRSGFGTVSLPRSQVKKVLKTEGDPGTIYLEEILVTRLKGKVERSSDEGKTWSSVTRSRPAAAAGTVVANVAPAPANAPNSLVAPGDRVRTGPDGEVDADVGYGTIHVGPGSDVEFRKSRSATLRIWMGEAGARLEGLPKANRFLVETPEGIMAVKGTTFIARVSKGTRLAVGQGEVEFQSQPVKAGQAVDAAEGRVAAPTGLSDADREALDRLRLTFSIPRIDTVYVPAGEFWMGTENPDPLLASARPRHKVYVSGFRIGRSMITLSQYRGFAQHVEATGDHSLCHPQERGYRNRKHQPGWWGKEPPGAENQPAYGIGWHDAFAFCEWAGGRLPTEAEWEKAARASSDVPPDKQRDGIVPARGTFFQTFSSPSANYGTYDWVLDYYDPQFYTKVPPGAKDPCNLNPVPVTLGTQSEPYASCKRGQASVVGESHSQREAFYTDTPHLNGAFRVCFPVASDGPGR
jgi:hypothetical protein